MADLRVPRILVPVDLGHSSEAALRCAQMLVSRLGAKLTVMYVNDALTLQSYDQIYTGYRDLPDEQQEMMEDAVRAFAAPHLGKTKYDVLVVADDTARAIATASERRDASLVIVGTHARHGWKRLIDGSVAESVVHMTDRPVIVVPQSDEDGRISRILCALNCTPCARPAVETASRLARGLSAQLHLVHVGPEKPNESFFSADGMIREWIDPDTAHCELRHIVTRDARAADRILECCDDVGAHMLVIGGDRCHDGIRPALGTTVEQLIRGSHVPIMSIVRAWPPLAA